MHALILLFICSLLNVKQQTFNSNPFEWLPGVWESKKKNSTRLEIWERTDKYALTGYGLKVSKRDTAILENLKLVYKDDTFWYIPTVQGQNNNEPVSFVLSESSDFRYVFENPAHDFPQRIIYHLKPVTREPFRCSLGDTLAVRVESLAGNGLDFHFLRR